MKTLKDVLFLLAEVYYMTGYILDMDSIYKMKATL